MGSMIDKCISLDEKGFTLIEALVAMGIFSIIMLATATMLFTGMSASASGNSRFIAGAIAQGQVDTLMRMPYANIASYAPTQPSDNADGRLATVDSRDFRTRWTITNIGPVPANPTMRRYLVETRWTDNTGRHTVTISGLRSP